VAEGVGPEFKPQYWKKKKRFEGQFEKIEYEQMRGRFTKIKKSKSLTTSSSKNVQIIILCF
jgi:hypothetical protein